MAKFRNIHTGEIVDKRIGDKSLLGYDFMPADAESMDYYKKYMPGVLSKLETLDKAKVNTASDTFKSNVDLISSYLPKVQSLLTQEGKLPEDLTLKAPDSITGDIKTVLDPYSSLIQNQSIEALKQAGVDVGKLREEAYSTATSPFAQAQLDAAKKQSEIAREDISKGVAGQTAQAYSDLARTGGLESGARNRLASSMGKTGIEQQQGVKRAEDLAAQNILQNMYGRRESLQGQMPGLQADLAQGYQGAAIAGANVINPYLQQLGTEQKQKFDTSSYNLATLLGEKKDVRAQQQDIDKLKAQIAAGQYTANIDLGPEKYAASRLNPYGSL